MNMYILLVIIVAIFTRPSNADACYTSMNNGALGTTFYVQQSTPFTAPYACQLATTNIDYTDPAYTLSIVSGEPTTCAEMIGIPSLSFGYYECEMKVPGVAGTVTSCMVVSSVKTYFESVYIKFFGNDTTRLYTGYFSGGLSNPTGPVLLNFDPTEKAHKYAFEWTSGYIRWYVDGKEVSSALGGKALPLTPNHFYANLLTEASGTITDDTRIPTDIKVDRNFDPVLSPTVSATFTNISYTPVNYIACDNIGIIPGDNGWKPYDPSDCDMRPHFTIYDDTLASGWTSPDSTLSDFASTKPTRTGTSAILWDDTPMNARLYFVTSKSFLSSDYYSFEFWIYGNGVFGQQIGITMLFDGGDKSQQVKINDVITDGVQPWVWSRCVFPFSLFGITPNNTKSVRGFELASISEVFGGRVGIDNVILGFELPICVNETQSLYAEGLASGVSDKSWGVYKMKSTEVVHTGQYSIQMNMYDNGGVRLHSDSPVSTSTFQGVSFWLNTAKLQGQDWTVAMTSPDSVTENNVAGAGALNLYKYYGGALPQQSGQWTRIVIPFYQFGIADGANLDGILFQLTSNNYQGILYIDDVDFVSQQDKEGASTSGADRVVVGMLLFIIVFIAF